MRYKKVEEMPTQVFTPLVKSCPKISIKLKFTIAVIISLIIIMPVGVWNLNCIQGKVFKQEAYTRSKLVLNFGEASRNYVIEELAPAVEKHTKTMIFEAQSNAFATRKIFEIFNEQLPDYIYKQPALNPLNYANKADKFESEIITYFQNNQNESEKTGYKKNQNTEWFYVAKPIKMETSCLKCHGRPEDAPQEIRDKYGTVNGFNWPVGDIISALIIYVPTKDLRTNQAVMMQAFIFTFIGLTIVIVSLIYLLFDKLVGTRINQISQVMNQAALNPGYTVRINDQGRDEIGRMAKIFNRMANALDDAYANLEHKVSARTLELEQTLQELQTTQAQLIQTEKMSSLGQLVAGIAHEINNPLSFISGNINHAEIYTKDLLKLIELFRQIYPQTDAEIQAYIQKIDLEFVTEDLPKLLSSMKIGSDRIDQIVLNLRNFSRLDQAEMKSVNLHEGIDSTLVILQHRLKANSDHPEIIVIKEYAELPLVECYPGQLNQVFMNLLSNAIDALVSHWENNSIKNGTQANFTPQILIKTEIVDSASIRVKIGDNGAGITEKVRTQIFNPFFTTKPIGKGTGLGLSISYKIVVEKHKGSIWCESELGQGTAFCIQIPVRQL
ncbi:c-type heme family protein [Anabaena sp. UHCC 0451]|uniref:c-type heme family protein n=1 Tax=Anabaena sp. UHCC 0451 TaxID=2055235 RepID=UPI002B210456|nr:DUF3365 domain-containing protein [Anabaena sp. UHCC 0451]MEA5575467.1 DUF3365 domain-containing protein [Anabaena sp. UHCC 0451]